jgi:hypothetical protein
MTPDQVKVECRAQAEVEMRDGIPINRVAALVIVMVWVGLAALAILWLVDFFG